MTSPATIDLILFQLNRCSGPDREIDRLIVIEMGYLRKVRYREAPDGRTLRSVYWQVPESERVVVLPYFTSSLLDAKRLVMAIAPYKACALAWRPDGAVAQIDGEEQYVSATPALALCVAALRFKNKNLGGYDFSHLNSPTLVPDK